ncbi:hypothetical protein [Halocalculus aciditolerans]|uniref:Uncharacterized protein n=1 Tax=Halocalculus aciditolerans TaxID=1383812 RepID=A0A830FJ50_9EURY|nr:hypothetical protein [Halocalculus aciditolerans]GGL57935.1 hypothetical protein GCM10009039_15160 [Halocalculus aciditolerans]
MTDVEKNVDKDTLNASQRRDAEAVLDLVDDDQDEQTNDRTVELGRR